MADRQEQGPKVLRIASRNQWYQRIHALKETREKRSHYRQFVVEGVRSINALRGNAAWHVAALLYADGKRLSNWAREVLAELRAGCYLVCDEALIGELSDKENTSEIMAIVGMPSIDGYHLPLGSGADCQSARTNSPRHEGGGVAVVLDRPSNPGNLGAIMRSCDALGSRGIVIVGHGVDPFDPVVVRAAAGSFFSVEMARLQAHAGFSAWIDALRNDLPDLQCVGTSAHGDTAPWDVDFSRPTVLVMGNETYGISAWLKERCDSMLRIDMAGTASSLNLACATTAILYEVQRQRGLAQL